MNLLDLFAGIGGFSLSADWNGIKTKAFVEWEEFPQKVLAKNFPGVPIWGDIKQFNKEVYENHYKSIGQTPPEIDIITGGFPCQPFSNAGQRNGTDDDRYLWPEMLRVIEEFKPTWVIGENVAGILSMVQPEGKITMESQTNSLFTQGSETDILFEYEFITESICKDFESIGYEVIPILVPACAVGAIHRRDRVWFVAYNSKRDDRGYFKGKIERQKQKSGKRIESNASPNSSQIQRNEKREKGQLIQSGKKGAAFSESDGSGFQGIITNPNETRVQRPKKSRSIKESGKNQNEFPFRFNPSELLRPTQSPVCRANDGFPVELDGYKLTRNQHRADRLKALGNAIVPQVANKIFKAIIEIEN